MRYPRHHMHFYHAQSNHGKWSPDITRAAPARPPVPPLQEQGRLRLGQDHGAGGKGLNGNISQNILLGRQCVEGWIVCLT